MRAALDSMNIMGRLLPKEERSQLAQDIVNRLMPTIDQTVNDQRQATIDMVTREDPA
jgi:hypothetical protein